jgi:Domain of Unknown Function with PDB structure (DUF3857)
MKKLSFVIVLMTFCLYLCAQKGKSKQADIPAFGKVEKTDLEMKECDFDKKAEALVLFEVGELDYLNGSGAELKKRVRIKILTKEGADRANIHLRYISYRNEEDITGLEARTYNLDEAGNIKMTEVEKKLIYDKKINKRSSEKVFTFPEVKPGTIIEYKYKHTNIGLIDWYFQRSIPVKYSRFTIDFPEEIEISAIPQCNHEYEQKQEEKGGRASKLYSMTNVPAFRDEPYIINEDYYKDHLETKIVAYPVNGRRESRIINWPKVIKFLMEDEDFGVQLKKNIPRTSDLDEKLKGIAAPYEKMKTIYKYVQQNMQWNEYMGIWAFDGVKSAWKDKKGTVGEINLILTNLLKDADLKAYPVLVSTHENGIINSADAGTYGNPGFNKFNKVMAYVEIDEKVYVLDASEKDMPVHLIPHDVLMTEGLVISKIETFEWGWKLLSDRTGSAKNMILINGQIDETGKMTGQASINSFDYARLGPAALVKKGKDKFMEQLSKEAGAGITIEEVNFENAESDSLPLIQKVKFNQTLSSSGEYSYFSANLFTGLEKNPFIADERFSDVFFGINQSYIIVANFVIPEGASFEELPKNMKMIMPDTSITISRVSQVNGNRLSVRIQLDFKQPLYPASQYAEFQEFYKRLFELLNEQFVIRKKA